MKDWVTYWFWTWYYDRFRIMSMIWNSSMSIYTVTSTKLRGEILWNYSSGGTHTHTAFFDKRNALFSTKTSKNTCCIGVQLYHSKCPKFGKTNRKKCTILPFYQTLLPFFTARMPLFSRISPVRGHSVTSWNLFTASFYLQKIRFYLNIVLF